MESMITTIDPGMKEVLSKLSSHHCGLHPKLHKESKGTSDTCTSDYSEWFSKFECDEGFCSNPGMEILCKYTFFICKRPYYVSRQAEMHGNRRFFSTEMEFAKNAYAYVLKAPSRS